VYLLIIPFSSQGEDTTIIVMRVLVIGSSIIDIFLSIEDESHIHIKDMDLTLKLGDKIPTSIKTLTLGGNGANVSVGLSRLGISTTFFTYLADDLFSKQIRESMIKENVQLMVEERKGGKSSLSLIFNFNTDRIIFSHHELAEHGFFYKDAEYPAYAYLTSIGARWEKAYHYAIDFLTRNAIPYAFSPGSHQLRDMGEECLNALHNATSLFVNKEEGITLIKEKGQTPATDVYALMKQLQACGPQLISLTDGAEGAYALDENGTTYHEKPLTSHTTEKTGAGDAYASGFLASYLYNNPIRTCMRWGIANAHAVMQKYGAQDGLLNKAEIERFNTA